MRHWTLKRKAKDFAGGIGYYLHQTWLLVVKGPLDDNDDSGWFDTGWHRPGVWSAAVFHNILAVIGVVALVQTALRR